MSTSRSKINSIEDPFYRDIDNWEKVSVPEHSKDVFHKRAALLNDYFKTTIPVKILLSKHGLTKSQFYYLLNRAFQNDGMGGILGWRGILPNRRLTEYKLARKSNTARAGRFQQFLAENPEIESAIKKIHFRQRSKDRIEGGYSPGRFTLRELHRLCIEHGLLLNEYPLNLKTGGREGLRLHLRILDRVYAHQSAAISGGTEAVTNLRATTSRDFKSYRPIVPYSQVECDAHRMDILMVVFICDGLGNVEPFLLERVWLYVLYDLVSQCILGYHLSLNPEPALEDFLSAVANALIPWRPKSLTIADLKYPEGGGLPSGILKECAWQCFDRLKVDNAMVHSSPWAQEQLMRTVGCSIAMGRPRSPVARSCIERLFRSLNQHSWHRLGSTTGSNPKSPRRKDPGRYAKKHKIALDEIEQLLDVIVAEHNASVHQGPPLYGKRTPLGYLSSFVKSDHFLRRPIKPQYQSSMPLLVRPITCTVRGSIKKSRRPYIQFQNAVYRNHILDDAWHLIGKEIILDLDINKAHAAPAHVQSTGHDLHILKAQPPWSEPHSLRQRKAITAMHRRGELDLSTDAIGAFERAKSKDASKSRRSVNALTSAQRMKNTEAPVGTESNPIRSMQPVNNRNFVPKKKTWISLGKARTPGCK